MAGIKTKDVVKGTVRQIGKAVSHADRFRDTYVQIKEKAEHTTHAAENSAEEYTAGRYGDCVERVTHEAAYQFDRQGRKGIEVTKENFQGAKDGIQRIKEKRAAELPDCKKTKAQTVQKSRVYAGRQNAKTVKRSARPMEQKTIRSAGKGTVKPTQRTIKTAGRTTKTPIRTTQMATKAAQRTAQTSAKAARKVSQTMGTTAKAAVAAVKSIFIGTKALTAAMFAGAWIAVAIIIFICLVSLLLSSAFGICFSGEEPETGMSLNSVVEGINTDYDSRIQAEKDAVLYDELEMSGSRAVWKDVLAVYAVKVNTDPDNPQEVATMDEGKKQLLTDIFWEMNEISSQTETHTEMVIKETDDGHGNIVRTETQESKTILFIVVSHKTVDEMTVQYGFDQEQKEYLFSLLADENNSLWALLLQSMPTE